MIRLAFIEDNINYQTAIRIYLSTIQDIELVWVKEDLQGMSELLATRPDVVIMDIDLGKDSGIQGVRQIKAALPQTAVLMLTVFEDQEKIFASLKAGAVGYLLKKDPPEKIVDAVRSIHRGEGVVNGVVARKIMEHFPGPQKEPLKLDTYDLTKREKELVMLLIDGFSYKEIAQRCFISVDTVNSHIRNIYSKLNVHTRSEITALLR